jgi:hypothetical protein
MGQEVKKKKRAVKNGGASGQWRMERRFGTRSGEYETPCGPLEEQPELPQKRKGYPSPAQAHAWSWPLTVPTRWMHSPVINRGARTREPFCSIAQECGPWRQRQMQRHWGCSRLGNEEYNAIPCVPQSSAFSVSQGGPSRLSPYPNLSAGSKSLISINPHIVQKLAPHSGFVQLGVRVVVRVSVIPGLCAHGIIAAHVYWRMWTCKTLKDVDCGARACVGCTVACLFGSRGTCMSLHRRHAPGQKDERL